MNKELQIFNKLAQQLFEEETTNPVGPYLKTAELEKSFDFCLSEAPISDQQLTELLAQLIAYTPKTGSKRFFNQLFGGRKSKATLGDLISVLLNNSMYTYKVAGPQVGIEKIIISTICEMIGYKNGGGTIATGGSVCNLMAMIMARDHANNMIRQKGISSKMIVYTSSESHYSISKNASFIGIGRDQVRYIDVDSKGKMIVKKLEQAIKKDIVQGSKPFFVNVTAGTTVLGAFDDIVPISEICKNHSLWCHLDGAYCGAVIFSRSYKHLLEGIAFTDSFCLNAHKMLGTPLTCSLIMTPHKKALHQSFSVDAEYLYQTDDLDYDLGKTSIQCGRRNDALKFWTLWKSVGHQGLEKIVDNSFRLADTAREYIKKHADYRLYSYENSVSVCFNYKDIPAQTLCNKLYRHSKLMVSFGSFQGETFVRLVTLNSVIEKEDIMAFFSIIETFKY